MYETSGAKCGDIRQTEALKTTEELCTTKISYNILESIRLLNNCFDCVDVIKNKLFGPQHLAEDSNTKDTEILGFFPKTVNDSYKIYYMLQGLNEELNKLSENV